MLTGESAARAESRRLRDRSLETVSPSWDVFGLEAANCARFSQRRRPSASARSALQRACHSLGREHPRRTSPDIAKTLAALGREESLGPLSMMRCNRLSDIYTRYKRPNDRLPRGPAPSPWGLTWADQAKAARTATLTLGDKTVELPVLSGLNDGPRCHRYPQALRGDGRLHLRPGLHLHRGMRSARSPSSTAMSAHCCTAAIRSTSWPRSRTSSRSATCCCTANCRPLPSTSRVRTQHHHVPHDAALEQFDRFFEGFRRDAHPMSIMCRHRRCAVGLLSRQHRHRHDVGSSANISSHRLIAKMPTIAARWPTSTTSRPALRVRRATRLSYAENFLRMCFSVPAEDMSSQSGAGQGHGPHLHPACRPRAERLDLDRTPGRFVGRQSVSPASRPASPAVGPGKHGGANEEALNMLEGDRHRRPDSRVRRQGVKEQAATC